MKYEEQLEIVKQAERTIKELKYYDENQCCCAEKYGFTFCEDYKPKENLLEL